MRLAGHIWVSEINKDRASHRKIISSSCEMTLAHINNTSDTFERHTVKSAYS